MHHIGIINTEGAMWKEQRKFLHEKLRGFGMTYMGNGKKSMETRIKVSFPENLYFIFLLQNLFFFPAKKKKNNKINFENLNYLLFSGR